MSDFVKALTRYNLTTWYLLPLIHLNKSSFGDGNHMETYVNQAGSVLTVDILHPHLIPVQNQIFKHYLYMGLKNQTSGVCSLYFRLPPKWQQDFLMFKEGKFSQFSDYAKDVIMEYSGLANGEDEQMVDARIWALTKDWRLREKWESELDVHLDDTLELLSIPKERNYREYLQESPS